MRSRSISLQVSWVVFRLAQVCVPYLKLEISTSGERNEIIRSSCLKNIFYLMGHGTSRINPGPRIRKVQRYTRLAPLIYRTYHTMNGAVFCSSSPSSITFQRGQCSLCIGSVITRITCHYLVDAVNLYYIFPISAPYCVAQYMGRHWGQVSLPFTLYALMILECTTNQKVQGKHRQGTPVGLANDVYQSLPVSV